MSGQMIGQYEVLGVIGEGGMGQVLHAMDRKMGQEVALKVLNPALLGSATATQRTQRELQALVALRGHPNVVTVYDYVEEPFSIVMEFLRGETLADRIRRSKGPLPAEAVFRYGKAVLSALEYAHSRGLLHRDVKPSNVMIVGFGAQEVVKVMDFGLAGFLGQASGLTRTGTRMGTPAYMAPEQHLGRAADERTDVYSFGVMLFEMCTGQQSYPDSLGSDYQISQAHIERPMPVASDVNPQLPSGMDAIIQRCTAKEMERRYSNCAEALADLERVERGEGASLLTMGSATGKWGEGSGAVAKTRLETTPMGSQGTDSTTKKCTFCAEVIQAGAQKCKHCGEFLDGSGAARPAVAGLIAGHRPVPVPQAPPEPAFVDWCKRLRAGQILVSRKATILVVVTQILGVIAALYVGLGSGMSGLAFGEMIVVALFVQFLAVPFAKGVGTAMDTAAVAHAKKDADLVIMRAASGREALMRLAQRAGDSFPRPDPAQVNAYFGLPRRCPGCLTEMAIQVSNGPVMCPGCSAIVSLG